LLLNATLLNVAIDFWLNVVFNLAMPKHPDADLILRLGGPTKVAGLLSLPKFGGAQRVQNWMARGIPSAMKVMRPDLFMPELATNTTTEGQGA
jgi:hypothetical protein